MIKTFIYKALILIPLLFGATYTYAAPDYQFNLTTLPDVNVNRDLGTSTSLLGSPRIWRDIFYSRNLVNGNMSNGCASWSSGGLTSLGVACGTGTVTGSGVSGQITFWDGLTSITSSSTLVWDNTRGFLGIGMASDGSDDCDGGPSSPLFVCGMYPGTSMIAVRNAHPTGSTNAFFLNDLGDKALYTGVGNSQDLQAPDFLGGGAYVMSAVNTDLTLGTDGVSGGLKTINIKTGTGYVGIGTTTPAYVLDVFGVDTVFRAGNTNAFIDFSNADSFPRLQGYQSNVPQWQVGTNDTIDTDALTIATQVNEPIKFGINNVEQASLNTSGLFTFNGGLLSLASSTLQNFTARNATTTNATTTTLFVTGVVSIASTSPSATLAVKGAGTGTGRTFAVSNSANTETLRILDNGLSTFTYNDNNFDGISFKNTNGGTTALSGANIRSADNLIRAQFIYVPSNYTAAGLRNTVLFNSVQSTDNLAFVSSSGGGTGDLYWQVGTGNKLMFIDGANGNIGIGNAVDETPNTTLEVSGTFSINSSNSAADGQYFFVNSSGLVGIGSTTPGFQLSVVGRAAFDGLSWNVGSTTCITNKKELVTCDSVANTADVTITNSTASSTLFRPQDSYTTRTFPANSLSPGKQICFDIRGTYSLDALGGSAIIRVVMGTGSASTTIAQLTTSALLGGASNSPFDGQGCVTVRSIGASGTVRGDGDVTYEITGGAETKDYAKGTATVNTTVAQTFDVTATWGAADTDNIITVTQADITIK